MKVEDLDVLRPDARIIRLGGKDVDVSFIPCGITFEVDKIVQELQKMDTTKLMENGETTRRAFELSVELCAAFCSHKHPELDKQWFYDNTDARQVQVFSNAVKEALMKAYAGVGTNSKNAVATRARKRT